MEESNLMSYSKRGKNSVQKVFVLDTSVILFDHEAVKRFDEHDIAIPITVLEELDELKKGGQHKNFAAREFIRFVDTASENHSLTDWVPLNGPTTGMLKVVHDVLPSTDSQAVFGSVKPDNRILNAALSLQENEPSREVVLVTKDIALRLKAKAMGLNAEDYVAGQVKPDRTVAYSGKSFIQDVQSNAIDDIYVNGLLNPLDLPDYTDVANHFHILRNGSKSALGCMDSVTPMINLVRRQTVYGVEPRNAEQTFAIHAIMNPAVRLVTIQGVAGTGKTLLALAGALEQRRNYKQIYVSRPVVPLSNKDIGYLPGDAQSKINPYMEPLWDNLRYIKNQFNETSKEYKVIADMLDKGKIEIIPLTYIRGRSLSNVIMIVDEAQNLSPHEIKTIITRAGENTKIIFTGDVNQIDTPYLDAKSNGLAHVVDKLKGHSLFAHITLEKGERSALADIANELL